MADAKNGSWKRFDAEMKWYERIRDEVMAAAEEAGVSMRQQLRLVLSCNLGLMMNLPYLLPDCLRKDPTVHKEVIQQS